MADPDTSDLATMSQDLNLGEKSARGNKRGERKERGGKQKSGGGRGGGEDREVMVSKALSKLLRHAAEDVGLALDAEGFARVDQVVSQPSLFVPFSDIRSWTSHARFYP